VPVSDFTFRKNAAAGREAARVASGVVNEPVEPIVVGQGAGCTI
jgi:hypothetical protein